MDESPATPDMVGAEAVRIAGQVAEQAANHAGATLAELRDAPALRQAAALFAAVWSTSEAANPMPFPLLRAMAAAGSYVAGARIGGELVAAIVGIVGLRAGRATLHSHILGVLPAAQGRSLGFALKLHQRAWALSSGITEVTWTFDPLVRRNAYFNLVKLGALGAAYHVNYYGAMDDGINAADETDRLQALWRLHDCAVVAAARGQLAAPATSAGDAMLDVGARDEPVLVRHSLPDADVLRVRVPADIVALRAAAPDTARAWRMAVRGTLGLAVAAGWLATGMSRDGWYTLSRRQQPDGGYRPQSPAPTSRPGTCGGTPPSTAAGSP